MPYIEQVEISGFWGDRHLIFNLFEDVNFLIGPNGSGKTTAINIIAAALTADFANLDRLPFRSIKIALHDPSTRRKPSVEVVKKQRERSPFPSITYSIKEMVTGETIQYSLDELEEERLLRPYSLRARSSMYRHLAAGITQRLEQLAPTTWLSIHRSAGARDPDERQSYEFTVDQKLEQISNSFVRFFSELEKRSTDETRKFQETIFLSLIYEHNVQEIFRAIQDLDIEQEEHALIDIFRKFKVPESRFLKLTRKHFQEVTRITDRMPEDAFALEDIFYMMNSWRIHSVIGEWNKLLNRQQHIFKPRDTFLDVLNNMLQRKTLVINEQNEIYASTQSGKMLAPFELSSGEKQLLIILGEALLQKSTPWIYIADEPELSLHVDWQVVLIDNLRRINPASQIIVATHSPDIVSHFSKNIHNMEDILA